MGKILKIFEPGGVRFDEYDERDLLPNEVRIGTLFSGISAGTELTHYRGTSPFRYKKWDNERRIFVEDKDTEYYPRGTGYEEVGKVIETGSNVSKINNGDIIYGAWTHKSTHIMNEDEAFTKRLFPELEPICGIFAQIGSIALNGILDARINVGETVAIFGQGVPGLICTQLAKLSGGKVIAMDLNGKRLELARKFGADYTINPGTENAGEVIKDITHGAGADVSIEVSGSVNALGEAIKSCSYSGKVIALGFYQDNSKELFLGQEFHHNRINIVCSQISGISPDLSNRWNRQRLNDTIMELQKERRLHLKDLITHMIPFENAFDMYRRLDSNSSDVLQAVLCFNQN